MLTLIERIRECAVCKDVLPAGPRPVVQLSAISKILIVGQAPGRRVHETGIPWNDSSGKTLRNWLNISESEFYDSDLFSIMSIGFCYPGKGASGDLPPQKKCAPLWHSEVLQNFQTRPLILLIGQYAQRYYLKDTWRGNITDTIRNYRDYLPKFFPLPHPSPRNQNWLKVNPWFREEVIPALQLNLREHLIQQLQRGDVDQKS